MQITPDEWEEWKAHHVTRAYKEAIGVIIEGITEELVQSAGLDSDIDNFRRGAIANARDILDIYFVGDE